jgi:ornithine cyclodeaminase
VRIDAEDVFALVTWAGAVAALRQALESGLDPAGQPHRAAVETVSGELLIMPAEHDGMAGVKVLGVAPGNIALGLPRIQATYILMDSQTLTPRAILDGAALTTLRTPALSAVAVDVLAAPDAHRLVVFGAGPQAEGHVHALRTVRPIDDIRIVSNSRTSSSALVARLREAGIAASTGQPADVADADLVVTATTAREPIFDGAVVRDDAMVVAVGSHHPDRRELDSVLMGRALVVVEDGATAMREAGDVIMAVEAGALLPEELVPLGDIIRRDECVTSTAQRRVPAVFKSVGQGWQDLVIAHKAYSAMQHRTLV